MDASASAGGKGCRRARRLKVWQRTCLVGVQRSIARSLLPPSEYARQMWSFPRCCLPASLMSHQLCAAIKHSLFVGAFAVRLASQTHARPSQGLLTNWYTQALTLPTFAVSLLCTILSARVQTALMKCTAAICLLCAAPASASVIYLVLPLLTGSAQFSWCLNVVPWHNILCIQEFKLEQMRRKGLPCRQGLCMLSQGCARMSSSESSKANPAAWSVCRPWQHNIDHNTAFMKSSTLSMIPCQSQHYKHGKGQAA